MTSDVNIPESLLNLSRTPNPPADFDAFWAETLSELEDVDAEWDRVPDTTFIRAGYTVDLIRFRSLGDHILYAWIASPSDGDKTANNGLLWIPGYSTGNPPPGPESLYPATVTMGINLHGNMPDTSYDHPRTNSSEYITTGIDDPKKYIFRYLVAHSIRALQVLSQQPDVDSHRVVASGMSQGGGLALIASALSPAVWQCFADMPWLCDLDLAVSLIDRKRYADRPNIVVPDSRLSIAEYAEQHLGAADEIYRTYRYIDPLNHARNISCPVQVSAGARDPSCRPPTIFSVYNNIISQKSMLYLPARGHEVVPEMHTFHAGALV